MQLQADSQVGILLARELGEAGPVGKDAFAPLRLERALQVRQQSARSEVRRPIPGRSGRAARQGHHSIDTEHRREADGVPEIRIVPRRDLRVRVQGIAPCVEGADPEAVLGNLVDPLAPRRGVTHEQAHVAMGGRRIAAGPHLEVGDLWRLANEPVHHFDQRAVRHRFADEADPGHVHVAVILDRSSRAYATMRTSQPL